MMNSATRNRKSILTFIDLCIVILFEYLSDKIQRYTVGTGLSVLCTAHSNRFQLFHDSGR
jgi:hypothetical protein